MKYKKTRYLIAFLLSLSLILLLEASSLGLLAEDIKPVERKEVEIELLLSASNNSAVENTQSGNNEKSIESKDEQEENNSKEKEAKNEEADKSSSAENEEKELENNDQIVEEKIEEKVEEPKKEAQEAKKKQDTMPAWLNNSETKAKEDNTKKEETETKEEEKKDKFDLESYLSELENDDSAEQENEVNKNNENKNDNNLKRNESDIESEKRETKTGNKKENKKETVAENSKNNEEQEVYDLREGTGEVKEIKKPGLKNYSAPAYPSDLRKRNIEGKVIVSLRIDKNGQSHNIKINQSSGFDSFDRAALNAVSNWDFKAAEKDGEKVEVIVNLPIRFELN